MEGYLYIHKDIQTKKVTSLKKMKNLFLLQFLDYYFENMFLLNNQNQNKYMMFWYC